MKPTRSTTAVLLTLSVTAAGWIGVGLIAPAAASPQAASQLTCPQGQHRIGSSRRVFATGEWINHGAVTATGGLYSGDWTSTVPVATLIVYAGTGSIAMPPVSYDPPVLSGTWATDGQHHVDSLLFCDPGATSTPTTTTPTSTTTTPTTTTTTPTTTTTTPTTTTTTPTDTTTTPVSRTTPATVSGTVSSTGPRHTTPGTTVLGGFTSKSGTSGGGLPRTGSNPVGLTMIAAALVLAGGLLWLAGGLLPVALRGRRFNRRH